MSKQLFAAISLGFAIVHFIGETVWHLKYGQYLPMLIVDYIAIGLLLVSGSVLLKTKRSPGWLCGAWGFEFCLNYRTFFARMEVLSQGGGDAMTQFEALVLGSFLGITAIFFLLAMYFCYEHEVDPNR
ncbi:MAG: hypothetical protein AAGI88_25195 [Pseudomonadota bacterium]